MFLFETIETLLFLIGKEIDELINVAQPRAWKEKVVLGVILTAMLNEGWINAIGSKVIKDWAERASAEKKINQIAGLLMPDCQIDARPISSVHAVREIRNGYAHAKPLVENITEEVWVEQTELAGDFFSGLVHPIEESLTIDRYRVLREDSAGFRKTLLDASGLKRWDIKTRLHESSVMISREDGGC